MSNTLGAESVSSAKAAACLVPFLVAFGPEFWTGAPRGRWREMRQINTWNKVVVDV